MAKRDSTSKLIDAIFDGFNREDLELGMVAAALCMSGPRVKVKAFSLAEKIIDLLAIDYDGGNFGRDDEETRVIIKARRLADHMDEDQSP